MNMIGTMCKSIVFIILLVSCIFLGLGYCVIPTYAYTQEVINEEKTVS